jgi:outer membrane immunogenic protein
VTAGAGMFLLVTWLPASLNVFSPSQPSATREKAMKRIVVFLAICVATIVSNGSPGKAIADDLDSRLVELENRNSNLRKMLRIEALEKENLALSQKLNVPAAQDRARDAAVATVNQPRERHVYNAMAADYPAKSEPPRYALAEGPAPRWAGPYLGLHGGMGFGKWATSFESSSTNNGVAATPLSVSGNSAAAGGLAGVQAGYMWQVGNFVFGPELDLSASTVGNKKNMPFSSLSVSPTSTFSQTSSLSSASSIKWLSTLRGRVGVAAGDWLFFGTGGLAAAGLDLETSSGNITASEVVVGYAAGGGLEYSFWPNARLRLEYLYYGFPGKSGSFEQSGSSTCTACIPPITSTFASSASLSVKPPTNVIRAGIDWRFN